MHLKKLELCGFKSFADKIVLNFGTGLGVIVGPNGSGKSNIADAMRWVLGEQSAKELRGGKMEDVIFAGTAHRRPLGFADVTIRLDNTDKTLPIEFDEVSITRRVYRSGESDFLINNSACRLKDIQQLFMDTGIGRDGYSIIGQGRIDEILSLKSEDRRNVFEEAAGIAKFKARRREAEIKLEREKQNQIRIGDIIAGLEEQLEPLSIQSEEAKKFLTLRDEYKSIHLNLFILEVKKIEAERLSLTETFKNVTAQSEDTKRILGTTRLAADEVKSKGADTDFRYRSLSADLVERTQATEKKQSEINLAINNIEKWQAEAKRLNTEINKRKEQITSKQNDLEAEKSKKQTHEAELNKVEENLKSQEADRARFEEKLLNETETAKSLNSDILRAMEEVAKAKMSLAEAENSYARQQDEKEKINELYSDNEALLARQKENLESLIAGEADFKKEFAKKTNHLRELRAYGEKLNIEATKHDVKLQKIKENLTSATGRLKALQALESAYEGYNRSVKAILSKKQDLIGICGAVGELFSVDKKFEAAIETALGGSLQNIVTDTDQDAKEAIEMLKSTREGRATFLPISSLKLSKGKFLSPEKLKNEPGYIGIASDLTRYDEKYVQVANFLLGDIAVFENLDMALTISKKHRHTIKIVTLDGERLSPGGAITGGYNLKQNTGVIGRGSQINELMTEVKNIQSELEKAIKLSEEISGKKEKSQKMIEEVLESLQKSRVEGEQIVVSIRSNEESLRQFEHTKHNLHEKNEELVLGLDAANRQVRKGYDNLAKQEAAQKKAEAALETYRLEAEKNRQDLSHEHDILTDLRIEVSKITEWIRHAETNIFRLSKEKTFLEEEKQLLENEKALNEAQIVQGEQGLKLLNDEISRHNKQLEQAKSDLKKSEEAKTELDGALAEVLSDEQALVEKSALLERELTRLEMRKENVDAAYKRIHDEVWEEYGLTYQNALKHKLDEVTPTELRKRQAEIKPILTEMHDVNIGAIEAYKTLKEKHDFLTEQRNDLLKAEAQLDEIIKGLTEQMEKQFKERFAQIDEHFKDVFSEMFSGGKAGLKLVDMDNVLESGIEITAQPPGKSLRNLMLLSGGERALTAIALLFAILRLKPSPFCVLDEIESALDDANVVRFTNFIKQYTDGTQFILISHRKGTMEAADSLYGITMEEQGVSKLVSVRLT